MLLPAILLAAFTVAHANTEMLNFAFPLDSHPLPVHSQYQLSPIEIRTNYLIATEFHFPNSTSQSSTQRVLHPLALAYTSSTTLGRLWDDLEKKYGIERRAIRLCWPASSQSADIKMELVSLAQDVFLSIQFSFSDNAILVPGSASSTTQQSIPYTLLLEPTHALVPESTLTLVLALIFALSFLRIFSVPSRMHRVLRTLSIGSNLSKID